MPHETDDFNFWTLRGQEGWRRPKKVSNLELELAKLNALKSYLEAAQVGVLRELNGT